MTDKYPYSEFNTTPRLLGLITRERVLESLRAAASWLGEARTAARGEGVGCRDTIYFRDGTVEWFFPHANAGEQIDVFLWLHEILGDERCLRHAFEYADGAIADPVRGIYRGECREAHGLPWYWTDIGTYTGIYGMRFPAAFYTLYRRTGKRIYEEYARLTADVLAARMTEAGLPDAGWSPKNGFAEGGKQIGSRAGYALGTFAFMHKATGDRQYLSAMEKMAACFERIQNPDGTFFQTYHVETAEPTDKSLKNHFFGYILNGLTDAYLCLPDSRLLRIAERLAAFVVANFYHRDVAPYCAGPSPYPTDQTDLDTPLIDPATGLFKLYRMTGEPSYLDVALKLWWQYYVRQTHCPGRPELHGAVLQGRNPRSGSPVEGFTDRFNAAYFRPDRVAHVCSYFMNQYVLSSRELLDLMSCGILGEATR